MVTSGQHIEGVTQSLFVLWLLWILLALSSYVRIEPAPYDVLGSGLFVVVFILGLRIPRGVRAPMFCLSIFMLANIIAGMCAPDPVHTLKSMVVRFYLVLSWFFFTCLIYENPIRVYEVIWGGYICAAIICMVAASLVYAGIIELPPATGHDYDVMDVIFEKERARGLFTDPNVFGPYLVPVVLYTFTRMIEGSGLRPLVMGALSVCFGFGILIGFSRGAWLNLGVSFLVAIVLRFYTERRLAQSARSFVRAGIFLGAAALVVIWAKPADTIGEMFETRAKLVQSYDTDRFANQAKIVENVLVNPIGIGPARAEETFAHAVHNLFLHVLIESGWVGAVAFYAFLAMTLWRGLNFCMQPTVIRDIYIIVFACTVGTLTQSLFVDSTHWRHMYLLLGMLWGPLLAWQADRAAFLSLRRSSVGF